METLLKVLKFLLWRRIVLVPALILLTGYWLASCSSVYVGPAQLGVRQVGFGSNSGIRRELLTTGTHFVISGYERVQACAGNPRLRVRLKIHLRVAARRPQRRLTEQGVDLVEDAQLDI